MNTNFLTKIKLTTFKIPYNSLAYLATVLTGFSALCAQVIWQKHLAILTGSEARSLSLVIAVFLLGLSGGYYAFGLLTEKKKFSRFLLLKFYGYLELLVGLYIGFFPLYFNFLKTISFHSGHFIIIDILISFLALLLPTFLMGATIPLLTATLPKNSEQVNSTHAKVYGWNSLGACLGALVSGFYLIPVFGLNLSLHGLSLLNIVAALIFIGNKQSGNIQKQEEPPTIPSPLSNSFFMLFVFLTGALLISFEIIFIKILNLSLGAGAYNFPIVLSLFIGGLALGSLSIKKQKLSLGFFIKQLLIALFLLEILFFTAPYWSIWFNHIRVSLVSLPSNYFIYYILIYLFLLVFLFPAIFFMGRILPLVYSLLKKTKKDYGKVCGSLYFFNTLGTVFGAVVIGYLAFYLFNLDILFKANIYILFLLSLTIVLWVKHKPAIFILSALGLLLLLLPTQWNRTGHEVGYFRTKVYNPKFHFKKLFFLPQSRGLNSQVTFFKDGPNTTVSLLSFYNLNQFSKKQMSNLKQLFSYNFKDNLSSYSIVVNGKSDGNSLGDFSTVFFMIPYLYSSQKEDLETAFIGLGTGLSAGAYTPLEDVKSIEVLEISPFVIQAIESTPAELNFNVMKNKKVKIIETDAFKYFTKSKKKFDIIVSEPSNPWVLGVENLFTYEFYELIAQSLNEEGVFGQWLHTYDIDPETIEIAIKTINQVFPYTSLYRVGYEDILIVASSSELQQLSKEKFNHPFVNKFYKAMGFKQVEDLYLTQIFDHQTMRQINSLSQKQPNSLLQAQLIYRTNKTMFLSSKTDPYDLINKLHPDKKITTKKRKAFNKYKNKSEEEWKRRCIEFKGFNFLCNLMHSYSRAYRFSKDKTKSYSERFAHYSFLRKRGLISYDKELMQGFFNELIKQKRVNLDLLSSYISEKIKLKKYEEAAQDALSFKKNNLINEQHYNNFEQDLKNIKKVHSSLEKELASI